MRLLEQALEEEQAHGEILPPWKRYPDEARFSGFWRQGTGEWFVMVWSHWAAGRSQSERMAYFRRHAPVPTDWADWVSDAIYDEGEPASDDEIVEQVRRLERETGLVDAAAWERWLTAG